jgi:hypothetical protein
MPCKKKCLGGGTGRRAGFKIQFFRECGFEPDFSLFNIKLRTQLSQTQGHGF